MSRGFIKEDRPGISLFQEVCGDCRNPVENRLVFRTNSFLQEQTNDDGVGLSWNEYIIMVGGNHQGISVLQSEPQYNLEDSLAIEMTLSEFEAPNVDHDQLMAVQK